MKLWSLLFVVVFVIFAACDKKSADSVLSIDSVEATDYYTVAQSSSSDDFGTGISPDSGHYVAPTTTTVTPGFDDPSASALEVGYTIGTDDKADVDALTLDQVDLTNSDRVVEFRVSSDFISSCKGIGLIGAIPCSLAGFFVNLSDIFGFANKSQRIQIQGDKTDGDTITSNAYLAKLYNVTKISNGVGLGAPDNIGNLVVYNDKLYFTGYNNVTPTPEQRLYSFDGTSVKLVTSLNGTSNVDDAMVPIAVYNGNLILNGKSAASTNFKKIFTYDGTTLKQISDINSGADDIIDPASKPLEWNGKLYFTLNSVVSNTANIYRYNGTLFQKITRFADGLGTKAIPKAATEASLYYVVRNGASDRLYRVKPDAVSFENELVAGALNSVDITAGAAVWSFDDSIYFSGAYTPDTAPNRRIFRVDEASKKLIRSSNIYFSAVATNGDFTYGIYNTGTEHVLYSYDGAKLERLTPAAFDTGAQPMLLSVASDGVYFHRDSGSGVELFRYRDYRLEKLFNLNRIETGGQVNSEIFYDNEFYFVNFKTSVENLFRIQLMD